MKRGLLLLSTLMLLLWPTVPVFGESIEIERLDFNVSTDLKEGDSPIAWVDYESTPILVNGHLKVEQGDVFDQNIHWTLAWVKLEYNEAAGTYSLASPSFNDNGDEGGYDFHVYWNPIEADTYYGLYVQCAFDYGEGPGYGAGSIFSMPGPELPLYVNGESFSPKIKCIEVGFDAWNEQKDCGRYWVYRGFYAITKSALGEEDPTEHTHTYGTEWKHDAESHWHECTALDGARSDFAGHIWNNGEVTSAATIATEGVKTYTCTVCGAKKTESIAKLKQQKPIEQITIPKKPTNKKPSVSKNKITVNWKHFKQNKKTKPIWKKIKKVQVQCATDKGFSNIVKSTMVGKKKTKAVIKGLAKKTTYYVRVRYYDGTGYSAWSGVKKVKTK